MGGRIAGEIRASRRRFAGEPLMIKTLFGQNRRWLAGEIEAIRRRNRGEPPKGESSAQIRGWFAGEIAVKRREFSHFFRSAVLGVGDFHKQPIRFFVASKVESSL